MVVTALAAGAERRTAMLDSILSLSERILDQAREGRWEVLCDQEGERQRLVWEYFAEPPSGREAELHAASLGRVLEISRELTRLASEQRERTAEALQEASRARSAKSRILCSMPARVMCSASRKTGTTNPRSDETATPISLKPW